MTSLVYIVDTQPRTSTVNELEFYSTPTTPEGKVIVLDQDAQMERLIDLKEIQSWKDGDIWF